MSKKLAFVMLLIAFAFALGAFAPTLAFADQVCCCRTGATGPVHCGICPCSGVVPTQSNKVDNSVVTLNGFQTAADHRVNDQCLTIPSVPKPVNLILKDQAAEPVFRFEPDKLLK